MSATEEASTPEELIAALYEEFGEEEADRMLVTMRAMRSMVNVWAAYNESPDGSEMEAKVRESLEAMLESLTTRPQHAVALIETLLGLVHDLRRGGSYEGFLESMGLNIDPARDTWKGPKREQPLA